MRFAALDLAEHGSLLTEARPAVIETEEEHGRVLALKGSTRDAVLPVLLRARNMQPKDLWSVFRSKGITSEAPRGKRGIGKETAKILAATFHVPVELFF